jgi:hypothetical protein
MFEWVTKRKNNTYALFVIDAFAEPGEKEPLGSQYQWDLVCGENFNEGAERTK